LRYSALCKSESHNKNRLPIRIVPRPASPVAEVNYLSKNLFSGLKVLNIFHLILQRVTGLKKNGQELEELMVVVGLRKWVLLLILMEQLVGWIATRIIAKKLKQVQGAHEKSSKFIFSIMFLFPFFKS